MLENCPSLRWRCLLRLSFFLYGGLILLNSPTISAQTATYLVESIEGTVMVARAGAQRFDPVQKGWILEVGDRVRVGPKSQLVVRRADQSTYRFDEESEFRIREPQTPASTRPRFNLLAGILYFFLRDKPGEVDVETPTVSAATRGTEFNIAVDPTDGTTLVTVIDGSVVLSNEFDTVTAETGQQAIVQPGRPPLLRAALDAVNVIQWTLYYPGVLDPRELPLTEEERAALAESLGNYAAGDLPGALETYPARRAPGSEAERVYLGALLLSVGQVEEAEPLLGLAAGVAGAGERSTTARLADALRQLIATVKQRPLGTNAAPEFATEWMAESYRLQSLAQLEEALEAARNAVAKSPEFGFAWARVAELEFSFGRIDAASDAIDTALQFSPRNAQAMALKGFLFAARNQIGAAIRQFNAAIEVDSSLANAWLGRGLARIRTGESEGGREDLLVAATLEPQRAFLRSYLGKAWADAGERKLAEHELELAKQFDPRDPTAWLYSALLKQQYNRINEAIRDLEHAQTLNTNRAIYRSGFLLDQDRAVRSANLARIYKDAGMSEWSVHEAGRAVAADYGNYSAHLFLAESYLHLSDPQLTNLRYETAANAEYLVANLLAPVGAGMLSPAISQGEYSSLFERRGFGLVSGTEYLSRGAWSQSAAQFGRFDKSEYSVEAYYRSDPGQRANADLEVENYTLRLKHQISPKDLIHAQLGFLNVVGGDLTQRYDPATGHTGYRFEEKQEPWIGIGYHRVWSPESHTLIFASRFQDEFIVRDQQRASLFLLRSNGSINSVFPISFEGRFKNLMEIYSAEAQHIWRRSRHQFIAGYGFQACEMDVGKTLQNPSLFRVYFPAPGIPLENREELNFHRHTVYGYYTYGVSEKLWITAGFSYDNASYPENFLDAPLSSDEKRVTQASPKAGIVWTPRDNTTIRAAYTRSMNGVTFDQSIRLEPTQVAGINQSFRSIVPESSGWGSPGGEEFEVFALSLEHRTRTRTYITVGAERLTSVATQLRGAFQPTLVFHGPGPPLFTAGISALRHDIDFSEDIAQVTINQLVGDEWAFSLNYRFADAHHDTRFPDISNDVEFTILTPHEEIESVLHTVTAQANFNHRSGVFAVVNGTWYLQDIDGYSSALRGDDLFQFNSFLGYRFFRRKAEISIGLLNVTDQDYRLLPLNLHAALPRERTMYFRFLWQL